MGTIAETAAWTEGVYQIEEGDDVLGGGPGSPDNKPHDDLAKRTAFLKGKFGAVLPEEEEE